jgi:hypothetical protein
MRGARSFRLVATAAIAPALAPAQVPEIQPGVRIRLIAAPVTGNRMVGTVMAWSGDTLTLASSAESLRRVRKGDIRRIEVSRGPSRIAGALQGILMLGIVPGALTLVATLPQGLEPEKYGASVAVVGSVIGGVVGLVLRSERWERVFPKRPPGESGGARRSPYGTS